MAGFMDIFKNMSAKDWGSLISSGAEAYGQYKQGKIASSLAKLQIDDVNAEKKRKKKFQSTLDTEWAKLPLGDK